MKSMSVVVVVGVLSVLAAAAHAQSISKQGFNFNVPPCPGKSTGVTTTVNTFSDHTPLPSCGGREQNGNTIKTYELVWTGHAWAEYMPSVKVTVVQSQAANQLVGSSGGTIAITPSIIGTLPEGTLGSTAVYLYQGNWVSLVASGAGNFTPHLVASGAGNLITNDGGTLVGPSGGTYSLQSVNAVDAVRTGAGVIKMNAANIAKYKQAEGKR
jgi:hypothetical protein